MGSKLELLEAEAVQLTAGERAAVAQVLLASLDEDAEIERTAKLVFANPLLGSVFRGTRRRYLLRRFPYSIIYQVTAGDLRIPAVSHHRRRPGYWAHRE